MLAIHPLNFVLDGGVRAYQRSKIASQADPK
jgi:hypothetical protein